MFASSINCCKNWIILEENFNIFEFFFEEEITNLQSLKSFINLRKLFLLFIQKFSVVF